MRTSTKALYLGGGLEESLTYTTGFLNIGVINYASLNVKSRFDYFLQNGKPEVKLLKLEFTIMEQPN